MFFVLFFNFLYLQEIKLLRGRVFYVLIIMFGGVSAMKKKKRNLRAILALS